MMARRGTAVIKTNTAMTKRSTETKIRTKAIGTRISIRAAVMKRNHHHQKIKIGNTRVHHPKNTNPRIEIEIVKKIGTKVISTEVKKTNTLVLRISTGK